MQFAMRNVVMVRSEVITAVTVEVIFLWVGDGGSRFLRNTGIYLPDYTQSPVPEDRSPTIHCCVNLKYHTLNFPQFGLPR
jgi:hypothetical protein